MLKRVCVLVCVLLLAACATTNTVQLMDGKGSSAKAVATYDIDPVRLSGLVWTDNLKKGNFVTIMADFPRTSQAYAEWDPSRIRYQAYAIDQGGKSYPANAVFAGFIGCRPRLFVMIEGLREMKAGVRVVTLSTMLNRAYDLTGREIAGFNAGDFQTDPGYRRTFVGDFGSSMTAVRQVQGQWRAITDNWTVYSTKSGEIITPLRPDQVEFLAGINPQYSYWQKVIGTARFGVSPDYVSTAMGIAIDLIQAASAKSQGFDAESLQTRMRQGYNLMIFEALRENGGCKQ